MRSWHRRVLDAAWSDERCVVTYRNSLYQGKLRRLSPSLGDFMKLHVKAFVPYPCVGGDICSLICLMRSILSLNCRYAHSRSCCTSHCWIFVSSLQLCLRCTRQGSDIGPKVWDGIESGKTISSQPFHVKRLSYDMRTRYVGLSNMSWFGAS